jgi:hypothetical protein
MSDSMDAFFDTLRTQQSGYPRLDLGLPILPGFIANKAGCPLKEMGGIGIFPYRIVL